MSNPYPDAETRRVFLDSMVDDRRDAARQGMPWMQRQMDAYMSEQNLELVKTLHDIIWVTPDGEARSKLQELMAYRKGFMNMGDLCRLDGWLNRDVEPA